MSAVGVQKWICWNDVGVVGGDVGSISRNHSSHHAYKPPKQFLWIEYLEISGLRALRELVAHWALALHPVFEDEKSNASDEETVKPKNCIKLTNSNNKFARNCFFTETDRVRKRERERERERERDRERERES